VPTRSRPRLSSGALLAVLACASPERDLGETADEPPNAMRGSGCEERAAAGDEGQQTPQTPQATLLSDFAGLWQGYTEDALGDVGPDGALPIYSFPSGSTSILLDVSQTDRVSATLTFGAGEQPQRETLPSLSGQNGIKAALVPMEGVAYSAEPVASALDVERAAVAEAPGEPLALDGKLELAFSIEEGSVSELYLRFGRDGLLGVFDGVPLLNERGFLTRPGTVRFSNAGAQGWASASRTARERSAWRTGTFNSP
jgi:hypothetical protein